MIGTVVSICRWAQRVWDRARAWRPFVRRYRAFFVEDLPDHLDQNKLYIVGEPTCAHYAAMSCPRHRCSTILTMNLLPDDKPLWQLALNKKGLPSLNPSVWRRVDCGCHFFLRNGRLEWCN